MYVVGIAAWYEWEGLGGQGTGCEWLAGLVSRVCVYVDCTDGRSGGGLRLVSRVCGRGAGRSGAGLRTLAGLVSRVCL